MSISLSAMTAFGFKPTGFVPTMRRNHARSSPVKAKEFTTASPIPLQHRPANNRNCFEVLAMKLAAG